ncbi:MAG: septum formation inhibitor Maf [Gammaproteobacteria bacterium]|nr:septum formation inhibitor Maf [Gammaproteobacteria bacterium]
MTRSAARVILASASPRRRALLEQIRVPYRVHAADVDEQLLPGESPASGAVRLAIAKARVVQDALGPLLPVLGADTIVVLDGEPLGKPRDRADALAMLARLSGRTHRVLSAVALATAAGVAHRLCDSAVRLRVLTDAECAAYWASGEPCDKAGGYAIQGLGAVFVAALEGSYSGVMGLPLFETAGLLAAAGVPCWEAAGA